MAKTLTEDQALDLAYLALHSHFASLHPLRLKMFRRRGLFEVDAEGKVTLTDAGWEALNESAATRLREMQAEQQFRAEVEAAPTQELIGLYESLVSSDMRRARAVFREIGSRADRGDDEALVWLGEEE